MRWVFACFLLSGLVAGAAENAPLGSWKMTSTGAKEEGLRLLDGADGATTITHRGGSAAVTTQSDAATPSQYLYFDLLDRGTPVSGPAYLVVEYYDGKPGGTITVEYDSARGEKTGDKYHVADDQWGGSFTGSKRWRTAVFLLKEPSWKSRQNLGADFRLGYATLVIRTVALYASEPREVSALSKANPQRLLREARIGRGGELVVGGFDPESVQSAQLQLRLLSNALPAMKAVGVTCHEGYVRWNLCEPEPGKYDWSIYDRYVDLYKKNGMKWVPFLIVGSAYSLPDWFYKKEGFQGYVCLEHGQESDVASLWNPALREHLARFLQAFAGHYRDSGVIDYILLGITGNYGEAIYIASGNDWTANTHGEYHTHAGFWAGDPFAVTDFRRFLKEKYGNPDALAKAWGTAVVDIDQIKPFLRKDAPSDRAWLDFCAWYMGSMNDYVRFWLGNLRKDWQGDIEVCTGGHAPAEHGADFGVQCRIAAEYGAGVRITNEASDYRLNFSLTRWIASASRQYGNYFSFEPAGRVSPEGVIGRIYNASASGAKRLHYYYPNLFEDERARANWVDWAHEFKQRDPRVEIAVYYPETQILLGDDKFLGKLQPLRDHFDFGYMSDQMIADGGLERTRALILLWGNTAEKATWERIQEWVNNGGLLLYADGIGRLRTVEGDESVHGALIGDGAAHGKGRVLVFKGDGNTRAYRDFLSTSLAGALEVSRATRAMVQADGKEDRVFVTLTGANRMLWYNEGELSAKGAGVGLPPHSIVTTGLR